MKREVRNALDMSDLKLSQITPKGELIMSGLRIYENYDPKTGKVVRIEETTTVDDEDIIRQLQWLDEQAPVFRATALLTKAEKAMREALHDVWEALRDGEKK